MIEANKSLLERVRRVGLQLGESKRQDRGEVCIERCSGSILLAL